MNPNAITSAPSIQMMNQDPAAGIETREGESLGAAVRRQASQLFQSEETDVFTEIVSKCNVIDKQMHLGVPLKSRMALGELLIGQRIRNPGGLTKHQENLCTWVMLEHTALNSNQQLSFDQLQSFMKEPDQFNMALKIAGQLSLTQERFTR
jgi:hypothetical protein